jgi:hypothetical protein
MLGAVHASALLQRCPAEGSRRGMLAVAIYAAVQLQGLHALHQSGVCLLAANKETMMHQLQGVLQLQAAGCAGSVGGCAECMVSMLDVGTCSMCKSGIWQ